LACSAGETHKPRGVKSNGSAYNNHGVHILRMRWRKIVEIDANEDSQASLVARRIAQGFAVRSSRGEDQDDD